MHSILHVELVEQTATTLQLRVWGDDPTDLRERTLALREIDDLVATAEADYYSPLPPQLQEIGERLFRWLDGAEHWLSTAIRAAENRAQVLVLAIATPHGLGHLPWEVLHDGTGFLVHALNPPVLPVRWRPAGPEPRSTENRPLQLLFMASSPVDLDPVLDFEGEEHAILTATRRWPLDLTVEESGCLEELAALVRDYGPGFFDVLHLSGHANHGQDDTPFFWLEDAEGHRVRVTAYELARELFHRPPLVFLSGCRTGQNAGDGEVRSLAEQLVANGFRAVLGWGRSVRDRDAVRAAQHIYQHLSSGDPITVALSRAYVLLRDDGVSNWHLLRLFFAGEPPAPLVTPLRRKDRPYAVGRPAESEFLDPATRTVKVATRAGFVGRRRLLQSSIRLLRARNVATVGLLLHAQGGRGKSSVAARLCDRLRREYQRVVVIGRLDEPSLVNAWVREILDPDTRQVLRDPSLELRLRIELTLRRLAEAGSPAPLFVLDDFEQNQPRAADGDLALAPHAEAALSALTGALAHAAVGRVLVTCRYTLPAPFDGSVVATGVPPLDETARQKQLLRLEQHSAWPGDARLLEDALAVADGNPRLLEWLHAVLAQPGLDSAALLDAMRGVEERFREHILAAHLVASLPEESRVLLGRMLLLREPVPFPAVRVLAPAHDDAALRGMLDRAARLGLLDVTEEDGAPHYRVPRQLAGGDPPLLPVADGADRTALVDAVLGVLYPRWWTETSDRPERRTLEMIRLATEIERKDELVELLDNLANDWLYADRYGETAALLEPRIALVDRHPAILFHLARARQSLGEGEASGALFREAVSGADQVDVRLRPHILYNYITWLHLQGEFDEVVRMIREELIPTLSGPDADRLLAVSLSLLAEVLATRGEREEALRIYREDVLPVFGPDGNALGRAITLRKMVWVLAQNGEEAEALRVLRDEVVPIYERLDFTRERAGTMGEIATLLARRGRYDETLQILREDVLPVFERLGEPREHAATLRIVANTLFARGEYDEALRILREEVLPPFERVGDVRERGVTLGKITEVLFARAEYDEALRILHDEMLPAFEHLKDVTSRAVTWGKIADVLFARGEYDEALRIRREEELPVFEQVNDVRESAITRGKIADILFFRGELDEALRIRREEVLPVLQRLGHVRDWAMTLGKTADVLALRGELDEALRIRLEEEIPVYERLGDVRERAVAQGRIVDILIARGEVDEALRLLREAVLPAVERLGSDRERAVVVGKVADVLIIRGELDEALRIRREEELPVYERLGDVRERAVALMKVGEALRLRGELEEALSVMRAEALPLVEDLGDVRLRAMTLGKIADVLTVRGELDEAERIHRNVELPVYERLGDVRERAGTLGKVAGLLAVRGETTEALRILREDVLPVFERLGDVRAQVSSKINLAIVLLHRGHGADRPLVAQLLEWSWREAARHGYAEAAQIAVLMQQLGIPLPAAT